MLPNRCQFAPISVTNGVVKPFVRRDTSFPLLSLWRLWRKSWCKMGILIAKISKISPVSVVYKRSVVKSVVSFLLNVFVIRSIEVCISVTIFALNFTVLHLKKFLTSANSDIWDCFPVTNFNYFFSFI